MQCGSVPGRAEGGMQDKRSGHRIVVMLKYESKTHVLFY